MLYFLMLLLYYFFPFLKRVTSGLKFCSIPQYPCLSRLLEVDLCAIHIPKRFLISQYQN
ncbi:hypothetical protein T01_941 [Trichinella spiralis]|uniref:Uncharacterized protein n=1 Tax=Trichinella spiralis TaxID=6334 RepID=A0A0V1AJF0_TRISP|nr:hypothetical protein T01_941 [Trichinella spiralis]